MGVDREAHRSGALKQSNKSHKTGRHRSKGAIDNEQKGIALNHKILVYSAIDVRIHILTILL